MLGNLESLDGLAGDASDEFKIFVDMEHRKPGQLSGGGDKEIWD